MSGVLGLCVGTDAPIRFRFTRFNSVRSDSVQYQYSRGVYVFTCGTALDSVRDTGIAGKPKVVCVINKYYKIIIFIYLGKYDWEIFFSRTNIYFLYLY